MNQLSKHYPLGQFNIHCESCPRNAYRACQVGGTGDTFSQYVLVSDRPGKSEIGTGRPFTGDSGQLLWNVLALDDLHPRDFYVTNAVKCPITEPKEPVIKHCRQYLGDELNNCVAKKLIIAVGSIAFKSLLPKVEGGVMKNCGKVYWSDEFKCWILVCINPAAVLRREGRDFHLFRATMGKIKNPVIELDVPLAVVTSDIALLEKWAGKPVTMDIETNAMLDYINPNSRITAIGFCDGREALIYKEDSFLNPYFWDVVKKLVIITHNGSFDIAFIKQKYDVDIEISHDTMMMAYQLNGTFGTDEEGGYSLEKLACIYLGVLPWKQLIKEGYDYDHPEYLSKDVYYPWKLWQMWRPRMEKVYYDLYIPIMNVKSELERGGMKFDFEMYVRLLLEYEAEITKLRARLQQLASNVPGARNNEIRRKIFTRILRETTLAFNTLSTEGKRFHQTKEGMIKLLTACRKNFPSLTYNPNSDLQNKAMFAYEFQRLGIPPFKLKDTDKLTTVDLLKRNRVPIDKPKGSDVWVCEKSEFFATYFTYAEKAHSKESFITDKWVRHDGRVHSNIKAHGTATGRLSSAQPNIFNMPKKLRKLFIPDHPDWVWISADYKQLEMCVAIALARHEEMLAQLAKGYDIHQVTSMWMTRLPVEEITPEIRRRAKEVNFGCIFGATPTTIAKYLSWGERVCSVEEATSFMKDNFGRLEKWREELIESVLNQGYTETVYGSRRYFFVVSNTNLHSVRNDIVNTTVQGTAAQMALLRLIEIVKGLPRISKRARVVNEVYDCIDIVCHKEEVSNVTDFVKHTMERSFNWTNLVFRVDVDVKERW